MLNRNNWLVTIIFIMCDSLAFVVTFYLVIVLRNFFLTLAIPNFVFRLANVLPLLQLGLIFTLGAFFIQGLYPGYGLTAVKELERMAKATSLAFFLLAAVSYFNRPFQDYPRSITLVAWLFMLAVLPLVHFLLRNVLSRTSWYGLPVVIFGESPWVDDVAFSLRRVRRLGWQPRTIMRLEDISTLENGKSLANIAILAPSDDPLVEEHARMLNQRFHKVILLRQFDHFGSLWVETRDLDGYLGLEFSYHLLAWPYRWMKRLIDIVSSSLALVILSPVLGLLALLIKLDSHGPVFFRQERIGFGSRLFKIFKFRTMVEGAEEKLDRLLMEDPVAREEYEKFHKLENDPRITRVGRFLRKFSLDELPQLLNVFSGEMSLTGPRAYMPSELETMGSYAPIILRVNPGMSGWWQVLGRHNTTFQRRLEMDEYYISNWSLWMDIYILLKTVTVVLGGKGV